MALKPTDTDVFGRTFAPNGRLAKVEKILLSSEGVWDECQVWLRYASEWFSSCCWRARKSDPVASACDLERREVVVRDGEAERFSGLELSAGEVGDDGLNEASGPG